MQKWSSEYINANICKSSRKSLPCRDFVLIASFFKLSILLYCIKIKSFSCFLAQQDPDYCWDLCNCSKCMLYENLQTCFFEFQFCLHYCKYLTSKVHAQKSGQVGGYCCCIQLKCMSDCVSAGPPISS